MPDKPFVINDRRKFTAEGEVRPGVQIERKPADDAPRKVTATGAPVPPRDASHSAGHDEDAAATQQRHTTPDDGSVSAQAGPHPVPANNVTAMPSRTPESDESVRHEAANAQADDVAEMPPPPSAEQTASASRAYDATVDRLDTAIRAANPGAERLPEMSFERFVQSLYMQALFQLGGAAEPGQQPQIDLLGARQTIDMLSIFASKTKGNLTTAEQSLLDHALFEARMAFLDVTQALARQSALRPGAMPPPPGGGPSIVR